MFANLGKHVLHSLWQRDVSYQGIALAMPKTIAIMSPFRGWASKNSRKFSARLNFASFLFHPSRIMIDV